MLHAQLIKNKPVCFIFLPPKQIICRGEVQGRIHKLPAVGMMEIWGGGLRSEAPESKFT